MAAASKRTTEEIRRDIESERERLAEAVESLRAGVAEVTDVTGKIRSKLPVVAAGAFGAGFVLWGGVGATMRLLARRGRESKTRARFGPFSLVDRS